MNRLASASKENGQRSSTTGCRVGIPPRIGKPNQVGQRVIPEGAGDRRVADPEAIWHIEPLGLIDVAFWVPCKGDVERARQDQLVGRHPAKSGLGDQRDDLIGHGSLRWPQTDWPVPEQPLMTGDRPRELLRCVLGMDEPARHA